MAFQPVEIYVLGTLASRMTHLGFGSLFFLLLGGVPGGVFGGLAQAAPCAVGHAGAAAAGVGDPAGGRRPTVLDPRRRARKFQRVVGGVHDADLAQAGGAEPEHRAGAGLLGAARAGGGEIRLHLGGARDRAGAPAPAARRAALVRQLEEQHVQLRPRLGQARRAPLPARRGARRARRSRRCRRSAPRGWPPTRGRSRR